MAKRRRATRPRDARKRDATPADTARGAGRARVALRPTRPATTTLLLGGAALVGLVVAIGAVLGALGPQASPSPSSSAGPTAGPSSSLGPTASAGPTSGLIPAPGVPTADPSGAYPAIDGIRCDRLEQTAYHIHAHLTIRFDGDAQPVPASIGLRDTCPYWLHTHANAGVIHVEAPAEQAVTLGMFFDVWGVVLADRQVLDRALEPGEGLFVFVDGVRFDGDPRAIDLTNLLLIEIQLGPAPVTPLPFDWSSTSG